MAPKRMPKVTSLASGSRGGGQFGPVNAAAYNDYDEAMDDGVELEEKGERFQVGVKAQRFYEQAESLYLRASQLTKSRQQIADATFNTARIQYLLATQFLLPPHNIAMLVKGVSESRKALYHAMPEPGSREDEDPNFLPSPFALDCYTQLGTAVQSLAELVDELDWPSQHLRQQVGVYGGYAEAQDPHPDLATATKLWKEAITIFQATESSQRGVIADQEMSSISDEGHSASMEQQVTTEVPSESVSNLQAETMNEDRSEDSQTALYGYTSSLVSTTSVVDTLLSMISCYTSLLQAATSPDVVESYMRDAREAVACAEALFQPSELPPIDQEDKSTKQQELLRAHLTLRTTYIAKTVEFFESQIPVSNAGLDTIDAELKTAMDKVHSWATRLTDSSAGSAESVKPDVATLCEVGESGQSLCRSALRRAAPMLEEGGTLDEASAAVVPATWTLATASAKLFSAALAALDTSSASKGQAAVLGQANTSTPTSRSRCRILLALSSFALFRSNPVFEALGVPGAIGTRAKLIDNARLYSRKAVTEIGLGWLLRPPTSSTQSRGGVVGGVRAAHGAAVPPGGWESVSLESEATLNLLRALLYRYKINTNDSNRAELESELKTCLNHIGVLARQPVDGSSDLADWLYGQGVKMFVDQIIEELGHRVCAEELVWWQELMAQLQSQ
ncbi:hypothetical protein BCV70DRAFT_199211 [Testicularia cyperi]|uniref:Uncharacterized protein n=1 Tax=Testicularia cyperi TaxID=1882483 RepID=A0A317XRH0_9BASI|nr:hypothetical protein BCV70DRAFT_199211 [Testicularia cyperi]